MKPSQASNVQIVLGETNPVLRSAFRSAFQRRGQSVVHIVHDGDTMRQTLEDQCVDLVVCADDLPNNDLRTMAQNVRQSSVGRNPFALMLATSRVGARYDRRKVVHSGVDTVARKPLSMSDITALIDRLAWARQPFVATNNYVGPSRRGSWRSDHSGRDLIEVPNSLKIKLLEPNAASRIEALIEQGVSEIDILRLNNSRNAIERAARRIAKHYADRPFASATDLQRLRTIAQGLASRYRTGRFAHFSVLAECLVGLADQVSVRTAGNMRRVAQSLELMAKLALLMRYMRLADNQALSAVQELVFQVRRYFELNSVR